MHQIAVGVPEVDRAALTNELGDLRASAVSGSSGGGLALDPDQLKLVVENVESLATVVSTLVTAWLAVRSARSTGSQSVATPPRVVLELVTRDVEVPVVDGVPHLPDDLPDSAHELVRVSLT